ncbi:MAG: LysM peptidoglycan-binding domain-containing protein [Verrucomicrobia bacterium]|nr:LysM peptidoglycan-binding domain-containing protein [Verrucomicrobiota bacterium]
MKKSWVYGIVIAAHCLAAAVFLQGCGTTTVGTSGRPAEPVMPGRPDPIEPTPAPVPVVHTPVKSWPAETTTYTIQKGDSLSVIAKRYGVSLQQLVALNHITNPDKVVEGQKLVLPGKMDLSAPAPSKPSSAAKDKDAYVVKPGDSLSVLASRFGTTVDAIRQANNLQGDKIMVDQKLTIPGKPSSSTNTAPSTAPRPSPAVKPQAATRPSPAPVSTPVVASATPAPVADASGKFRDYTVQEGEDLYSVSLMWDVTVDELQRLNRLAGTELNAGQVLKIPMAE